VRNPSTNGVGQAERLASVRFLTAILAKAFAQQDRRGRRARSTPSSNSLRPCCTDQSGWGLGPGSVEDGPALRERDFAVAGRG
jgi:hypothetical protein